MNCVLWQCKTVQVPLHTGPRLQCLCSCPSHLVSPCEEFHQSVVPWCSTATDAGCSEFCLLPGVVCRLTFGSYISEHGRINACLKTSPGVRSKSCLQLDSGYLGINKNWPKIPKYPKYLKFFISFAEDKPGQMDRVVDPNGVRHALKVTRLPAQEGGSKPEEFMSYYCTVLLICISLHINHIILWYIMCIYTTYIAYTIYKYIQNDIESHRCIYCTSRLY